MTGKNLDKLARANKQEFWFKWLKFCLFMRDVDPFAKFKSIGGSKQASFVSDTSQFEDDDPEQLKLPHTNTDRLRARVAPLFKTLIVILLIEASLVSFVQYKLLRRQYLPHLERNGSSLFVQNLVDLIDGLSVNPLAALKEVTLLHYIAPTSYNFLSFISMHLFSRGQFVSNTPLRFILKPQHELKRIDFDIRLKLDRMRISLYACKLFQTNRFRQIRSRLLLGLTTTDDFGGRFELDRLEQQDKFFSRQMHHLMRDMRKEVGSLRPINLTPEYYERHSAQTKMAVSSVFLLMALVSPVFFLSYFISPYLTRCPELNCNPLHMFGMLELLFIAQMWLALLIACVAYSRTVVASILLVISQLILINSSRRELRKCKQMILMGETTDCNGIGKLTSESRNKLVFKTLVKVMVCDDEIKRNSRSISMEVAEQIYFAIGPVAVFLLSDRFNIAETKMIRYLFLLFGLLMADVMMIAYAHVNSRIMDYERSLWSSLAAILKSYQDCYHSIQLVTSLNLNRSLKFNKATESTFEQPDLSVKCCSFVIDMLVKFVHSSGGDIKRHMSQALGMDLNYEKIIQANFFIIFSYSITVTMLSTR